jgi:hypothetical protein
MLRYKRVPEEVEKEQPDEGAPTALDWSYFEDRYWAYLNILIIQRIGNGEFAERVGIGQIHVDAWNNANPQCGLFKLV